MRFKYLTLTIFIFGCLATGVQGSSPGGQPRPDGDGDDGMDDLERGRFEDFCDPEADFEAIRSTAEKDFCRDSLGNKSCGVAPCEQICHSMFDDDSDFRPSNARGGGGDRAGDEVPRRARSAGATGPSRIDVKPPCALRLDFSFFLQKKDISHALQYFKKLGKFKIFQIFYLTTVNRKLISVSNIINPCLMGK